MKIVASFLSIYFAYGCIGVAQQVGGSSQLAFTSSSIELQRSFEWAKQQALVYSRAGTGSIGPWYEAALPGRESFCMRDVSHQSEGASALGLTAANANIFRRFADSAAQSRDWAAYWEIDSKGEPSSADYVSDKDFWFNLPANFDLLDASVRLWRWTGDDTYRDDPVFRRFRDSTVKDYIRSWQLTPEQILKRPRIANQRAAEGRFINSRGIPSYTEGPTDFIFGTDLLASEVRALHAFQEIAIGEEDRKLQPQLDAMPNALQQLIERVAWSQQEHHYFGTIHQNLTGSGSGDAMLLYFGAIEDASHREAALSYVSSPDYWKNIGIEEESYLPLTLFRYGRTEAAYRVMADLSNPQKARREYPEVSYSVLEALVSGAMGVQPSHAHDSYDVLTMSQLPFENDTATLSRVSIKRNLLEVTHTGTTETKLTNVSGPTIRWRAAFRGNLSTLHLNGKIVAAHQTTTAEGVTLSWADAVVPSGQAVMARR